MMNSLNHFFLPILFLFETATASKKKNENHLNRMATINVFLALAKAENFVRSDK